MISTLNDDNYMYIKPMIEACSEGMYFIVINTCINMRYRSWYSPISLTLPVDLT